MRQRNNKDTTKIAVQRTLSQESVIMCRVTTDQREIADYITEQYKWYADEGIAGCIGSVLATGLKTLLSNTSADSAEVSK